MVYIVYINAAANAAYTIKHPHEQFNFDYRAGYPIDHGYSGYWIDKKGFDHLKQIKKSRQLTCQDGISARDTFPRIWS